VTHQEGKALIQRCLNSPEPQAPLEEPYPHPNSQLREEPSTPTAPMNPPQHVESSLVLMVGKQIPVSQAFNSGNLKDLSTVATKWAHQLHQPVVCLVGGLASNGVDLFRSPTDRVAPDVVVGLKVAEVDYTNASQPSFSIEKLRAFLTTGDQGLPEELWQEIVAKPYVELNEKGWKSNNGEFYTPSLSQTAIYIVSTYPNAFVNIVYGVRKPGTNGKGGQVVGIPCHSPESYICKLDVDDRSHQQRSITTEGVEGVAYYHLLPELWK